MSIDKQHLATLLEQISENIADFNVESCAGGGNNRVFILSNHKQKFVVKWYYSHPSDTRKRLQAEYGFLQYTKKLGLNNVPKALACLPEHNLALYEFIEGKKLNASEVSENRIIEAAQFFAQLNKPENRKYAQHILNASDACFSVHEHIISVQKRAAKFIEGLDPADTIVWEFATKLNNKLYEISNSIEAAANKSINTPLEIELRCISPSDFGFHNALLQASDTLCFIDFEYAGWDDPAKMVCDFFCQPDIPADVTYIDYFINHALNFTEDLEPVKERVHLLLPLNKIKWCFILLNEFLPDSARRRQFANSDFDLHGRKILQLAKATTLFDSII